MKKIRHYIFWPPVILLLAALVISLIDKEVFLEITSAMNNWILDTFGWLFSIGTLLMVVICFLLMFSRVGKIRIGGENAVPLLNRWRLFSIILCTTIATGILFWGTAEPIFHLTAPPDTLGIESGSNEAAQFALSTMFLHWSFTPYAIYTIPALMFAIAFYNQKRSFSLVSTLFPFLKKKEGANLWLSTLIDGICLYSLVAGMAASLGAGILTLAGGLNHLFSFENKFFLLLSICFLIVITFIISSITGLMKGIRFLSDINIKIFFFLALFMFIVGPTAYLIDFSFQGLSAYISEFFNKSLFILIHPNDPWSKDWTVFYWANWLAWAPITSLFLGRIAYGYTVRSFMFFCWIIPSLFAIIWMSVFSGTAIHMQLRQISDLAFVLNTAGPESVIYTILSNLPFRDFVIFLFLFATFVSYVTAADSNTEAMGGISSTGISPTSPASHPFIKLVWGLLVGAVAFVMINFAGIEGIKMLSNLGGLPALFLILCISIGLLRLILWPRKFIDTDKNQKD